MSRVLVCGGRDFTDYLWFAHNMNIVRDSHGPFTVVIHGAAKGADWCAHLYATSGKQLPELAFHAEWKIYGRRAGPIRNQRMIDEGNPDLVVAFPGGKGTADMVRRAKAAGIPVVEVGDPSP